MSDEITDMELGRINAAIQDLVNEVESIESSCQNMMVEMGEITTKALENIETYAGHYQEGDLSTYTQALAEMTRRQTLQVIAWKVSALIDAFDQINYHLTNTNQISDAIEQLTAGVFK